jgi:16S rRNA (guanine527-N7)-methyltransferase
LSPDQIARFGAFRRLLLEWNAKFNLTAVTEPTEIERRLFLDALLLSPVIDRLAPDRSGRLVDVGSGAGFPAIPLAIVQPERPITLIEATGKKVSFLDHLITTLGLGQVRAIHARAEDVARQPAHRAGFDLATARAVSSLSALIELTMPLLREGGHAVFPKGLDLTEELAAGVRAAGLIGARIIGDEVAPGGNTRVVIVAKQQPTSDHYPRRAGIPAREPLGTVANGQAGEVAASWPGQPRHRPRSGPRPRDETAARRRIAG